jgi:5'(3')-deoxyribonucleotidase
VTPVVYLDLDGVLVNFVQGALDFLKSDNCISDVTWNFPKDMFGYADPYCPKFWDQFASEDFWANLKWTDEGQSLVKAVEEMVGQKNIGLLTTPMDIKGCVEGKRTWVKNNLPEYQKQLIITPAKYLLASEGKILVDDHDPNLEKFTKHPDGKLTGGQAILVPRPWNCGKPRTVGKGGFDVSVTKSELRWAIRRIV